MKKIFNIIIFLIASSTFAQKGDIKKANELFAQKNYVEAIQLYESIKRPNQEVLEKLGDSYYYTNKLVAASKIYSRLYGIYKDKIDKEYLFRYAHSLKAVYDYQRADRILKEYYGYEVDTKKFIDNLKENISYKYEFQSMTKDPQMGDFGLSFWNDRVVFAGIRNTNGPVYGWNQKPYLDLFVGDVSDEGLLVNVEPFSEEINTDTHEAFAVFTKDGKTMYFNRTSDKRVVVEGEEFATVKLFKAEYVDDKWTNVVELPFCSDYYSIQSPALNNEETKLYFASDMPGTLGSLDLFYVTINEDGTYGEPVNLGENINTKHREQFPFISLKDELYFASDGHQGFGGLDVFVSYKSNGQYGVPENLGEEINTGYDDFAFVFDKSGKYGYFSSNRKGLDNLYSFVRTYMSKRNTIEGEIRDKNSFELLPGTTVTLYDERNRLISETVVGPSGKYMFSSRPSTKYRLEAVKDFYISYSEWIETNEDGRIFKDIELLIETYDDAEEIIVKKDDGFTYVQLENIYFDLDKWNIKPEAEKILNVLVDLMKKYPRIELELGAHTDSRASELYNHTLSSKRAKSAVDYLISQGIEGSRLKWKGYGESKPLVRCGDNCSEEEHSINRRCEFIILK